MQSLSGEEKERFFEDCALTICSLGGRNYLEHMREVYRLTCVFDRQGGRKDRLSGPLGTFINLIIDAREGRVAVRLRPDLNPDDLSGVTLSPDRLYSRFKHYADDPLSGDSQGQESY